MREAGEAAGEHLDGAEQAQSLRVVPALWVRQQPPQNAGRSKFDLLERFGVRLLRRVSVDAIFNALLAVLQRVHRLHVYGGKFCCKYCKINYKLFKIFYLGTIVVIVVADLVVAAVLWWPANPFDEKWADNELKGNSGDSANRQTDQKSSQKSDLIKANP